MKLCEMDARLREIERSGDQAKLLKAKLRAGEPVIWYRACTVCKDWKTHPQIVCPIRSPEDAGPIGAMQVDGYWVEMCIDEHEQYGSETEALKFAASVLHNPKPLTN